MEKIHSRTRKRKNRRFKMISGVFVQDQEELTEEIELRLFDRQKHEKIKEEMQGLWE